ncbi:hypothetical protein M426DRAFT_117738 [Hypoxylon sp. CI-4A]|nr:hypothetical protein M426DRAFT_117738 [Hypoxylon sp. CI-4A]
MMFWTDAGRLGTHFLKNSFIIVMLRFAALCRMSRGSPFPPLLSHAPVLGNTTKTMRWVRQRCCTINDDNTSLTDGDSSGGSIGVSRTDNLAVASDRLRR